MILPLPSRSPCSGDGNVLIALCGRRKARWGLHCRGLYRAKGRTLDGARGPGRRIIDPHFRSSLQVGWLQVAAYHTCAGEHSRENARAAASAPAGTTASAPARTASCAPAGAAACAPAGAATCAPTRPATCAPAGTATRAPAGATANCTTCSERHVGKKRSKQWGSLSERYRGCR